MTINSIALYAAVKEKNIEDVSSHIKNALAEAHGVIQRKFKENIEFNYLKWVGSASNNGDEIVTKARLQNAIRALNNPVKINYFTGSIPNLVASFLIAKDTQIEAKLKAKWAAILLDMIIIGCDCHAKNSNQCSIIDYLIQAKQSQEAKESKVIDASAILTAYDEINKRFDIKKLCALKNIDLTAGQYMSLAELAKPVGLFGVNPNEKKTDLSTSLDADNGSPRPPAPVDETSRLLQNDTNSIKSPKENGHAPVKNRSCCSWF